MKIYLDSVIYLHAVDLEGFIFGFSKLDNCDLAMRRPEPFSNW
jgi:hypothetical protein